MVEYDIWNNKLSTTKMTHSKGHCIKYRWPFREHEANTESTQQEPAFAN